MTCNSTDLAPSSPALRRPGFGSLDLGRALKALAAWRDLRRQRRALAELEAHSLHDIGITPEDARREALRPFWDGPSYWR
ncbi:MAG: DUF1127 domain-containing protein [Pararhodobacter sp.]